MADQDFKIKVVTTADTAGIKQTSAEIDALKRKSDEFAARQARQTAEAEAKWAKSQLNPKNVPPAAPPTETGAGAVGSAAAVGTIITLLTGAISKWKEFLEEEDRIIERMEAAREKTHELGLEVADMLDAMKSAERINVEPLDVSINRLTQDVTRLKTELKIAFETGDYGGAKRLIAALSVVEGQLDRVTEARKRSNAEAEKSAVLAEREAQSFLKNAVATASPQVQAALKNEEAARRARAAGQEREADQFQKTADRYKKQFSEAESQEYGGITSPVRLGKKAGPGESQSILDDIARNKINFERQLKGEPPLPNTPQGDQALSQAIANAFDQTMQKYFGP